jgi:hypothetical protein
MFSCDYAYVKAAGFKEPVGLPAHKATKTTRAWAHTPPSFVFLDFQGFDQKI